MASRLPLEPSSDAPERERSAKAASKRARRSGRPERSGRSGRPERSGRSPASLGRILRAFWPYTRKHRPVMVSSFLALFATIGLRTLEPWPLKFVFDQVLVPQQSASALTALQLDPVALVALAGAALVVIIGLRALASYLQQVGFALVGHRVLAEVRGDLYRHLQTLPLAFHHRARRGDLIVRMTGDIGRLRDVAVTALMPLIGNVLVLLAMAGLMLWLHWQLALLTLVTLPLYWLPTLRLGRRIRQVSRVQRKREGALASTAAEAMGAIQVVKALSLEPLFTRAFTQQNKKSLKEGVKAKRLATRLQTTVQLMIALSTALVLAFGARLVLLGQLTPGELLVFLAYLKMMFRPMQDFSKYTGRLAKAAASGERVLSLFDRVPSIRDAPNAVSAPPFRGAIEFRDVTFGYTRDSRVFDGLRLTVPPGQRLALVGPSGIGKSTLLNLVLRLYDPEDGQVLIDDHDIRSFTVRSLRRQMAVVLQDNLLFAGTIAENIAFGAGADVARPAEAASPADAKRLAARVVAAARLANAHDFISALPDGYKTVVGERGVTLSAGQRQRLAIARAAMRDAPIVLLDEPTTGLDEENEQAVVEALERLTRGRTTILITHDLHHAARCDRIAYLAGGRVVEQGSHQALLDHDGHYAAWWRLEALRRRRLPENPSEVEHVSAS